MQRAVQTGPQATPCRVAAECSGYVSLLQNAAQVSSYVNRSHKWQPHTREVTAEDTAGAAKLLSTFVVLRRKYHARLHATRKTCAITCAASGSAKCLFISGHDFRAERLP